MAAEGATLGAGFSPEGNRGQGALSGALLGAAGSAIPSIGHGIGSLRNRISSIRNLDRLKEEGQITNEQYNEAINKEKSLEDLMKQHGVETNTNKLEAELPYYYKQSEQLSNELKDIPEVDTSKMLGSPEGENIIPKAQKLLNESNEDVAKKEFAIRNHLGEGLTHDVRVAKGLNDIINSKKKEIGSIYNKVGEELKQTELLSLLVEMLNKLQTI